jgi:branched-chain amino acid transport system substrate-binding protein
MKLKLRVALLVVGCVIYSTFCFGQSLKPIKVGAISNAVFPESVQAAKAYFDVVNESGGIHGRKIEYIPLLEGDSPRQAASSAGVLIKDPEVVALVGSAGFLDCPVNAKSYVAANLISMQGASIAPDCFRSSHIVPMNNGPVIGLENAINFAFNQLKSPKICVSMLDLPGMVPAYRELIERDTKRYPRPLANVQIVQANVDLQPFFKTQIDQGCNAIIFTGHEAGALAWLESTAKMNINNVDLIFLTPAYTMGIAKKATTLSTNVYAMAEFEPWQSSSFAIADWKRLMLKNKLPLSSLSQGGYTAAQLFVRTAREIKEPITRNKFSKALSENPPQNHAFLGLPFKLNKDNGNAPNRTSLPMNAVDGFWRIAWPQWIEASIPKAP